MSLIGEFFYSCFFYCSIHPFDLSIGPRMFNFCCPVLNAIFSTYSVKNVFKGIGVAGMIGTLYAIVCENLLYFVGYRGNKVL